MKLKRIVYLELLIAVFWLLMACRNTEEKAPLLTPTPTVALQETAAPTNTDTPSPTLAMAPKETLTPTPNPTNTPSPTPTNTPTMTPKETLSPTPTPSPTNTPTPEPLDITVCFTGDVSLADDAVTTKQWLDSGMDLSKCISPELLKEMNEADLLCINSEFAFTDRGTRVEKAYNFRAKPERISVLLEMGIDVAMLANNHVFDYGDVGLRDTLKTFENAGVAYVGAGRNLEEAMRPYYIEIDGITIAFVAATRAEKNQIVTRQATETESGVLRCYDTELFLEVIKEADANADVVLACVHWGTEYSTVLEKVQLSTGKEYLDAGADAVIGSHSHILQGMEIYKGKPIVYSLGNFWFNNKTLDSMLLKLHITGERENPQIQVEMVPALQSKNRTAYVSDPEKQDKLYRYMEKISVNIAIDENGMVREK